MLSNPKHSGVPEDSKSPTLGVLGFTPTLGQSGVATKKEALKKRLHPKLLRRKNPNNPLKKGRRRKK